MLNQKCPFQHSRSLLWPQLTSDHVHRLNCTRIKLGLGHKLPLYQRKPATITKQNINSDKPFLSLLWRGEVDMFNIMQPTSTLTKACHDLTSFYEHRQMIANHKNETSKLSGDLCYKRNHPSCALMFNTGVFLAQKWDCFLKKAAIRIMNAADQSTQDATLLNNTVIRFPSHQAIFLLLE